MKIMDHRNKGILSAIFSAVFLGLAPVFGKQAIMLGFSPLAVVAIRTFIATILLSLIVILFQRKFFYIYPIGLAGCILAGCINGLGSIFYYVSFARLDASIGQLLYSFYPLFVAFWLLLDRQPINRMTILRLLLIGPGIYFLVSAAEQSIDPVGAGMMIIASALYGLHLIINQRILYEVPAPTVTLYTLLSMSITVIMAWIIFDHQLPDSGLTWWPVIVMGVITFLSRVALFIGVKHLGGLQTAVLGLGELIVTIVLATFWLGESLTTIQWIGALLLALSLFLVGYDKPPPQKRHTKGILAWLNPPEISPTDMPW